MVRHSFARRWLEGALCVWKHHSKGVQSVRRQGFWGRLRLQLSERLAHLLFDLMRPDCGIANAAV